MNRRIQDMKALEGLKIADFSWVFTGPLITKTLAEYGAQVIKIEGKVRGDGERRRHPYKDHVMGLNRALHFNQNNTTKYSIAINLANPNGVELAKKLVVWADVVVENFAAGAIDRMGLGYNELKKIKPDIIMLSASMQGQTGPHATHPGYGHQLSALTGFHQIVGWPDRAPQHFSAYTDFVSPHFGLAIILAALDYRRRTGLGQHFDMSQYESGLHFLASSILDYQVNGRVATRNGNRCDYAAPHGAYRCRDIYRSNVLVDRWCTISVFTDDEWHGFCRVLGNPSWTLDERFATLLGRKQNEDQLEKLVEAWTCSRYAEDVMSTMQAGGVPAGIVAVAEDQLDHDPQLKYRRVFPELAHTEVGTYRAPVPPFTLSKSEVQIWAAPLIGEHNEYVCKEILKMSDEEIADAIITGALE